MNIIILNRNIRKISGVSERSTIRDDYGRTSVGTIYDNTVLQRVVSNRRCSGRSEEDHRRSRNAGIRDRQTAVRSGTADRTINGDTARTDRTNKRGIRCSRYDTSTTGRVDLDRKVTAGRLLSQSIEPVCSILAGRQVAGDLNIDVAGGNAVVYRLKDAGCSGQGTVIAARGTNSPRAADRLCDQITVRGCRRSRHRIDIRSAESCTRI